MIKQTVNDTGGFSLVELLLVMAMMGVVMGAVYSLYITNLRISYSQNEVSDVQVNLSMAMDSVLRDLRMAGILIDYQAGILPIQTFVNNAGPTPADLDPATGAANPGSDGITLNIASASGVYGRISADNSTSTFTLKPKKLDSQAGDAEQFKVGDIVRIIRPMDNSQPAGVTYTVEAVTGGVGAGAQTIKVKESVTVAFKKTDVIARANAYNPPTPTALTLVPSPNTVQYAVITNAAAPSTTTTHPSCPVNQFCLARRLNGETDPNAGNGPRWEIVAQNIRNFQLRYVTSDNADDIADAPTDLSTVTAVLVTISGQTATRFGPSNTISVRRLESLVKLMNRRTGT